MGRVLHAAAWLAAAAVAAGCGPSRRALREPHPVLPLQAETLDGAPFTVGGGGPVRLVELWATWCAPCGPAADRARAVLARHPRVVAYGISVDGDRAALLQRLRDDPPPGTPLVLPGGSAAAARAGMTELPTFLVLDARGRVAGVVVGLTPSLGAELTRLIRRAEGRGAEPD
jgi:thiol-disulfide isomerase/thioredoxin